MEQKLTLTDREFKEIQLALYYERHCNHGTDGHNRLLLLAKLAHYAGIELNSDKKSLLGIGKFTVESET